VPGLPIKVIIDNLRLLRTVIQADIDITNALTGGLLEAAQHVEGEIKAKIFELHDSRTGNMARSYTAAPLFREKKSWSTGVYSTLIYAGIQDQGGTIHPKTVKNLAIPISDYVKVKVGLWPRDWPKGALHLVRSKKGNMLLADKSGKPHYALKTKVEIPGTGYLEEAREAAEPGVRKILGDRVADKALKRWGR